MKSVTVKGSFSRHHCSNECHSRGHSRSIKPPLLFKESKHSSSILPSCCSFSALLNEENAKAALGRVDVRWFEKVLNRENGTTKAKHSRDSEQHADECQPPETSSSTMESPTKLLEAHDLALTPQPFASPPLSTPNVHHHTSQRIRKTHDENEPAASTSLCDSGNDICSIAQLSPVTPHVQEQRCNTKTPGLSDISWSPAQMYMLGEPSPVDWYLTNRQTTTPTFMKQLFKTPSSVSKLADSSFNTPGPFLSTPLRMSVSLGADLNDSNLSWTSSLATPQGSTSKDTLAVPHTNKDQASTAIPKALFTSATEVPDCETNQQRRTDPDSQVNSVPLQNLHMSIEDDVFETTIKSDIEDGDREVVGINTVVKESVAINAKAEDEVDGMGNHSILRRGHLRDEDCPGMEEMINQLERTDHKRQFTGNFADLTSTEDGKNPKQELPHILQEEAGKRIAKDNCGSPILSHCASSQEDCPMADFSVACEQRLQKTYVSSSRRIPTKSEDISDSVSGCSHSPSDPPEEHITDKLLNSPAQVPVTSSARKPSCCKTQTVSQKAVKQQTPTNSQELDISNLSSIDRSRMEDTLAFFLLTPPQTRSRLAKLKNKRLEKNNNSVLDVAHNENTDSKSLKCPSSGKGKGQVSESCRCESVGQRDISENPSRKGDKELLKMEEIRPTKVEHSQVSVLEKDGSVKVVEHLSESRADQLCSHKKDDEVRSRGGLCQTITNGTKNEEQVPQHAKMHTSVSQYAGSVTPVRQTKVHVVPSPSKFTSPDAFSQISPQYLDALCLMTDQVSSSTDIRSDVQLKPEEQSRFSKLDQNESSHESSLSSFKTPSTDLKCIPEAKHHSSTDTGSKSNPPLTTATTEFQVSIDNIEASLEHETPSQLFRMQPKASASRKFFYPSASTTKSGNSKRRSRQWLTEAILVKTEENHQQDDQPPSTESSSPSREKVLTDGTNHMHQSSGGSNIISNSTPAPRKSAFVTFNNFVKSERVPLSGPSAASQNTASKNTGQHPLHGLTTSSKPQQTVRFSSEISANSRIAFNETTPLSRRTVNPRSSTSYCGARRRTDTHGLPLPKRLKTAMDEEQIRPEDAQIFGREMIGDSMSSREKLMIDATPQSKSLARVDLSVSQDLKTKNHFDHKCQDEVVSDWVSIPAAKTDFSRNSGISIREVTTCNRQSLENGKELKNGSIPRSVTFASASGKPIDIPESALEKAKQFWSDDEEEIPMSVSSECASKTATQIPNYAFVKAEALPRTRNEEHSLRPKSTSVEEESTEKHPLNAALKPSTPLGFQDRNTSSLPESNLQDPKVRKTLSPKKPLRSYSNQCELTAGKASSNPGRKSRSTQHVSENENTEQAQTGGQGSHEEKNQQEKIPAFTGFSFASGKSVTISDAALQRAEKLMEQADVDIPTSVSFASASGKPIKISKSNLERGHALLEDLEHTVSNENHPPLQQAKTNELSKGSDTPSIGQQYHSNDKMNYHRLPQGFRPFKTPAKVDPSLKLSPQRDSSLQPEHSDNRSKNLPTIPETDVLTVVPEVPIAEQTAAAEISDFEEEFLSASQAQREIEAAEETESAYAFMQAADDSYSQFENLPENSVNIPTGIDSPSHPDTDGIKTSHKPEMVEDFESAGGRITALIVENLKVDLIPPSQISSPASDVLDKAFVQSQDSVKDRRETENSSAHQNKNYLGDVPRAPGLDALGADTRLHATAPVSSPQITTKPFVGFCTASGHKVTVSNEALRKAKMFWDAEMDIEKTTPQEPMEESGTSEFSHSKKKDLSSNKVGRKEIDVLGKSSLSPEEGASENEVQFKKEMGNSKPSVETELHQALNELMKIEERKDDVVPTVGFQTARGKPVSVSEEALAKAKSLFLEVEENQGEIQFPEAQKNKNTGEATVEERKKPFTSFPVGFQTASGSRVHISEESLMNARRVLESPEGNTNKQPSARNRFGTTEGRHTVPCGFTTASGNKVKVSRESFERARNLIEVPCENLPTDDNNSTTSAFTKEQPFASFLTASGNKVSVSKAALEKAKRLFTDPDDSSVPPDEKIERSENQRKQGNKEQEGTISLGFQTASGSSASVSKSSLKKPKLMLDSPEESKTTKSVGFQTAGGSKVAISAASLANAKKFFAEDAPERNQYLRVNEEQEGHISLGFQTASGSSVSVSKSSLKKAKLMLDSPEESKTTKSVGFQTAGGSKVAISAASLANAKKFFAEDVPERNQYLRVNEEQEGHISLGFQTASGSSVSVSKSSLKKAKLMLDSPEESKTTKSVGFQTAGRSKVAISAASLANAKKFFTEDAPESTERNQHQRGFGFSTASGSKVEVSAEALQRAKKLFENLDDAPGESVSLQGNASCQEADLVSIGSDRRGASKTPGEDLTDAVVPNVQGKTAVCKKHTDLNQNSLSIAQGLSRKQNGPGTHQQSFSPFQRQTNSLTKHKSPAFKPPYQAVHNKSSHSRRGSTRPPDNLQVVPQLNKRASNDNSLQLCAPVAKRARVEDGSLADEDGDVSSAVKLEANVTSLGKWEQARTDQASRIQGKKSQVIKPLPGTLITKRQQGPRLPLHELVNAQPPEHYSRTELVEAGIHQSTLDLTASSTEDFKFMLADYFDRCVLESGEGVTLSDGGRLVPDDAGLAGKEEFLNALLDMPGVDPKLLPAGWVSNHYRWIVWKLGAMERAYPQQLAGRFLTPDWVVMQLKYRYDREIDHAQRPVLRKILERDDVPSRRMVLCVAGIQYAETNAGVMVNPEGTDQKDKDKAPSLPVPTLELTDCWYSVKTIVDKPLAGLIKAGKIHIGQKLCICGAELVGSQDACSPLEVPDCLRLRISANCTRRARYDARLGLQPCPQPFPLSLASLYPEGGTVGCVDVVIIRTYPMQFMEKHSEGGCTFRGRRAEEREAGRFAQEKQKQMERLYAKIQEEYQEKENKKETSSRRSSSGQKLTAKQVAKLQTGQELYEALTDAMDPGALQALLSERQMALLGDYQRCLHEKQQTDLQGHFRRAMDEKDREKKIQRNVTPLLRVRIGDHLAKPGAEPQTYQLTIWRPTDDLIQLLAEGKRFRIFNLSASAGRFCLGSTNIQFSSTRATRYQTMPFQHDSSQDLYHRREVTQFSDILHQVFQPVYSEVDVTGVVVSAVEHANQSSSQMVYLGDAAANIIAVKFWGGLQAHCLESVVKQGVILACSNLQWRSNSASSSIPCLHASDGVSVTQNPKGDYLRDAMQELHNQIKNPKTFAQDLEAKIAEMVALQTRYSVPRTPNPVGISPVVPWSGPRPIGESNFALNVTPEARSGMSTITPRAQATNHSLYSLPSSHKANQLGPHTVVSPFPAVSHREGVASTPRGGAPYSLPSTPASDRLAKRRLDALRRYDLLSRVPSPPSYSPLPTSVSNRAMRNFCPPSCRRTIVQQGSSSHAKSPNIEIRGLGIEHGSSDVAKVAQHSGHPNRASLVTPLKQIIHNASVTDPSGDVRPRAGNSPEEEMTPSQRQVQEVLGMSYKSLGEIDWEWTQQVDPPSPEPRTSSSQPSPSFSYGTSSQSSSLTDEGLNAAPLSSDLNKNNLKQNTTDGKFSVDKQEHGASTVLTSHENGQGDCRRENVSSSKRKLARRKRGQDVQNPAEVLDSIQKQESLTPKEHTAVGRSGDHLKSKRIDAKNREKWPGPYGDSKRGLEQKVSCVNGTNDSAKRTVEHRRGTNETGRGTEETELGTKEPRLGTEEAGLGTKEAEFGTKETRLITEETGLGTEEPGLGTKKVGFGTKEAELEMKKPGLGTEETRLGTKEAEEGIDVTNKVVAKTEECAKGTKELLRGTKEALGPSSDAIYAVKSSGDGIIKDGTDEPLQLQNKVQASEAGVSRPGRRKQKKRSRVDLSILEQGYLLGDVVGKQARRVTRSATRRSASEGV